MIKTKYYKQIDGKKVEFVIDYQKYLYLSYMNIVELILPDGCRVVNCENNQLKELIIPNSCKSISCHNNQLKELIVTDVCTFVRADMKSVTELNKVYDLRLWI